MTLVRRKHLNTTFHLPFGQFGISCLKGLSDFGILPISGIQAYYQDCSSGGSYVKPSENNLFICVRSSMWYHFHVLYLHKLFFDVEKTVNQ